MQDAPIVHLDAYMTALMILVTIVAAHIRKVTLGIDCHLVNITETDSLPLETGDLGLSGVPHSLFGKAIFTQLLLRNESTLFIGSKGQDNTCTSHKVFIVGQSQKNASGMRPRSIGLTTRIPPKSEDMAGRNLHAVLANDTTRFFLIEQQTVCASLTLIF